MSLCQVLNAQNGEDSLKYVEIDNIVITAHPKENGELKKLPLMSASFSLSDIERKNVTSLKSISTSVPNLFIPSYGSKQTTSVYIRGIGSRINTPAIGLYVDNIPFINKNAFDFNLYNVERIDVLRGPQGTLYGRNTMGGLIRVFTKSPFSYQGTDVHLGAATHGKYKASLVHYHRLSNRFAFYSGFFYEHDGGFFKNTAKGNTHIDKSNEFGGNIKASYLPWTNTHIDLSVDYENINQGAYPYVYEGVIDGDDYLRDLKGKVGYNRKGDYRRDLLNVGLNYQHNANDFDFYSVTGFQFMKDKMNMDQDYTPLDIFSLLQKQNSKTLSQEIVLKSRSQRRWEWLTGISGFYEWLSTMGPVTFHDDGVRTMIEDNVNGVFKRLQSAHKGMPSMYIDVNNDEFVIDGDFDTPTANVALYHQSTINGLIVRNLSLTLGARVEYERTWIDYASKTDMAFDFIIPMLTQMSGGKQMSDMMKNIPISPSFLGKLNDGNWEFLPKIALKYDFKDRNSVYVSLSKGYRSGGYNIQMFSDLISGRMSSEMIAAINDKSGGMVEKMMGGGLTTMIGKEMDVKTAVTYKPERSWNYELGSHLSFDGGKLNVDFAAFLMNTTNQQISRFATSGLGRVTANAGRSRSIGVESSLKYKISKAMELSADYGYTHATFRNYNRGNGENLRGNSVPFVPRHTMSIGLQYDFKMKRGSFLDGVILYADCRGAGRIYWTEINNVSQNFYLIANGRISMYKGKMSVDLWSDNMFDKNYSSFCFESMGRRFSQRGMPVRMGVDFRFRL